ncbi:hypothetical protein ABID21_000640 [Pseudorhizobium tarimense]|uniref:Uncharacterized protein n=1 Tax=Pseudorhizobium tarimense TaxID=1079109 RepID=A0ABV2H1X1_9HYPH|nr:hypothetical protein [Pseudorhizobium tarimense]MCJ8517845.1 hypothetical protein [Pseudorhizobium tarimense]
MDWAALDYEKIANAIVILVVGLAAGLGLKSGRSGRRSTTNTGGDAVEIAGALIDSSTAKALEAGVKSLSSAVEAASVENLNYRKSMERAVEDLTDALKEVTHALASLKEEIIRSKRG